MIALGETDGHKFHLIFILYKPLIQNVIENQFNSRCGILSDFEIQFNGHQLLINYNNKKYIILKQILVIVIF